MTRPNVTMASDGFPVFKEGLSRRQWLEAHKGERKQALIQALRQPELTVHEVDTDGFRVAPQRDEPVGIAARVEALQDEAEDSAHEEDEAPTEEDLDA